MGTNRNTEEYLGGGITVCVSQNHKFGTDAVLLSDFSLPKDAKKPELACDLGSGCGIIPLLWFGRGCAPQKVYAVEIQSEGAALMKLSAEKNKIGDRFFPVEAISEGDGKYTIDADACIECGACADVCPVDAPSAE